MAKTRLKDVDDERLQELRIRYRKRRGQDEKDEDTYQRILKEIARRRVLRRDPGLRGKVKRGSKNLWRLLITLPVALVLMLGLVTYLMVRPSTPTLPALEEFFDSEGRILRRVTYHMDGPHRKGMAEISIFYSSGNLEKRWRCGASGSLERYQHFTDHGQMLCQEWSEGESTEPFSLETMVKDHQVDSGWFERYHPGGNTAVRGQLRKGLPFGPWKHWSTDGKKLKTDSFLEGVFHGYRHQDQDGVPRRTLYRMGKAVESLDPTLEGFPTPEAMQALSIHDGLGVVQKKLKPFHLPWIQEALFQHRKNPSIPYQLLSGQKLEFQPKVTHPSTSQLPLLAYMKVEDIHGLNLPWSKSLNTTLEEDQFLTGPGWLHTGPPSRLREGYPFPIFLTSTLPSTPVSRLSEQHWGLPAQVYPCITARGEQDYRATTSSIPLFAHLFAKHANLEHLLWHPAFYQHAIVDFKRKRGEDRHLMGMDLLQSVEFLFFSDRLGMIVQHYDREIIEQKQPREFFRSMMQRPDTHIVGLDLITLGDRVSDPNAGGAASTLPISASPLRHFRLRPDLFDPKSIHNVEEKVSIGGGQHQHLARFRMPFLLRQHQDAIEIHDPYLMVSITVSKILPELVLQAAQNFKARPR